MLDWLRRYLWKMLQLDDAVKLIVGDIRALVRREVLEYIAGKAKALAADSTTPAAPITTTLRALQDDAKTSQKVRDSHLG